MNNTTDILPILFPFFGAVFVFSMSTACCLKRQLSNKYQILETRINALEQKIVSLPTQKQEAPAMIPAVIPVPAKYIQYPSYPPQQYIIPATQPTQYVHRTL
jgi:hypothetical protein